MNSTSKIRIGFIGAGAICRSRHLPGLAKVDDAQVVAVCNRSRESSQTIAREFNIPDIESDWRALLARKDIDAVFIGTWPYMHKEMSIAALEAGKHVFCQARMCMDLAEAKAMIVAASLHPHLVNMICPPPTRMPFEPWIQRTIAQGRLGRIVLVSLRSVNGGNLDTGKVHWREEVRYSGKQILAMGIFAETLNAWVGPYESLSANLATPIASKAGPDGKPVEIKVPQVVAITGRLASGATAVEYHTGVAADKSTHGNELIIHGDKGTIRYTFGKTIEFAEAGGELKPVDVSAELQRDWCVEADFCAAVRAARAGKSWHVSPDFSEGLQYMRKVEAVHQSAAAGKAVTLAAL